MDLFLSITVLVALALIATSRRLYTARRSRFASLLISGGWPAVLVGVALGPHGGVVVTEETLTFASPLVVLVLGWVGIMVGLQARLEILRRIPRPHFTLVVGDIIFTIIGIGSIAAIGLAWWTSGEVNAAILITPWALLVASALGWSMETRSLRDESTPHDQSTELFLRVPSALASIAAIVLFGLLELIGTSSNSTGVQTLALHSSALHLGAIVALAVVLGVTGRFLLTRAGRSRANQLTVFLGLVTFVGGLSTELSSSPLFGATLAGFVLGNIATNDVLRFERFVVEAEHMIGVIVFLLAGLTADFHLTLIGMTLAAALVFVRIGLKLTLMRWAAVRQRRMAHSLTPVLSHPTVIRQSPIAVALALSLALVEPSVFHRRLLGIVLIVGVAADLASLLLWRLSRRVAPGSGGEAT